MNSHFFVFTLSLRPRFSSFLSLDSFCTHPKQPPEVFCKKRRSQKFRKIHRKTPVLEPLKKRLWHRCFPVNFTRFPRTPFLQNTSGRLILTHQCSCNGIYCFCLSHAFFFLVFVIIINFIVKYFSNFS